jgi:hypothetical protein
MVLRAANNLGCKLLLDLEAAIGIELMNKAFADHLGHLL